MSYTIQQQVDGQFDDVVESTIAALQDEGFGVLCDIDVESTFAEKLDVDYRKYRILGACNPELAYEGLEEEIDLGTLLPCNVVVYENDDGEVIVSAVNPGQLVGITGNENLESLSAEVTQRFERVLDSL